MYISCIIELFISLFMTTTRLGISDEKIKFSGNSFRGYIYLSTVPRSVANRNRYCPSFKCTLKLVLVFSEADTGPKLN